MKFICINSFINIKKRNKQNLNKPKISNYKVINKMKNNFKKIYKKWKKKKII